MRLISLILMLILPGAVAAQDWSLLKEPGTVALMRHALAPGVGDPASFDLEDCSTQRNLDSRGREQARQIGAAMREVGVQFDAVWTSQWCRCVETAELLDMGTPEEFPALNSHFAGQGDPERQAAEVMARISKMPEDARLLLITHQVNVSELSGTGTTSGEIIVTRRTDNGLEVVGRIAVAP
ncbi:histidine phosphatase family protein [Roseovarius sp.]|uniref:histidine phosphatase family protein n=1 Tax=Roseovarius sp. TaxID=1486281 RepID=UPI003D1313E5